MLTQKQKKIETTAIALGASAVVVIIGKIVWAYFTTR